MDIEGIGAETARQLYDRGLVTDIADIYTLTRDQLLTLDGFGPRSADRLLEGVEASKSVPFDRVVYALSIPNVGATMSKKIAKAAGDIDTLAAMTDEQLIAIDDVGPAMAQGITEYFADERNRRNIECLRAAGVQMHMPDDITDERSDLLAGQTIVISGTFSRHSRDEYKAMIEMHGGKNSGSISKKTTAVLAGENMGPSKLEKAAALGIPLLSEDDFMQLLENS